MNNVGSAWRASSRRQKATIVVALVLALGGIATLAAPPAAPVPGQPSTPAGGTASSASQEATSVAAAVTPTGPLASTPASNGPTAKATTAPKPTPKPTPIPTPKATPKPVVLTLRIASVTSPAYRNSFATLVARTHSGASCSIEVDYASGPSSAAGLGDKTASSSGSVSWTWKVGGRTTLGTWPIYVSCTWKGQSANAQTSFRVA
jgi:hypothetical protein